MKKILTLSLFSFLLFAATAQEVKKITAENFSVEIPLNWGLMNLPGHILLVCEPAGKELTVQTNFDVEIHETAADLAEFCDNYEMDTNRYFTMFLVVERNEILFKRFSAIMVHCKAMVMGVPTEWKSVFFKKDSKIYKLTTTSLVGKFNTAKEITDKIFESFKFE